MTIHNINNYYNNNVENVINNLIDNFSNYNIINHPIDQIINNKYPRGVPVVDGYVFNGWDENPPVVLGRFSNDLNFVTHHENIPRGQSVVIGRPVFPTWALDVCVIGGRRI